MTIESLTDAEKNELFASLQTEIKSLKADLKAGRDDDRNDVIAEIAEFAKELDEEFDAKVYEDMSKSSLFIFRNQYKKVLDMQNKAKRSEAKFIDRTKNVSKFDDQSNGAVFDKVVDIVSTMWNLPILNKEQKEEVMYQHLAEGIAYEVV